MSKLTNLARVNRKNPTDSEKKLFYALRDLKIAHFQRQFPIGDKYIADIACRKHRLVIECDGSQHYTESGLASDWARDEFLQRYGYKIIRFSNGDIMKNINGVLYEICRELGVGYQF
ncbi:MAG: endonuclease domain-containing protein [Rickettsiales bacterium]|jgi:very-short-patch-repair endonuclease|nr:endonuclease domain-containing protein [Rickettsiales bacterium]